MNAEERLAHAYLAEHPEEAAQLVERANAADAAEVLAALEPKVAAQVFAAIGPTPGSGCAAALSNEAFAAIVAELPLPSAAAAVRRLDPSRYDPVLSLLDDEWGTQVRRLLTYPENSAGALADPLVLALAEDITVADAQRRLRRSQRHLFFYLYILSREGMLVGALNVAELMAARLKDTLASIMRRGVVRLDAHTDLATVAMHPAWRDFDALPVVDGDGRLVGAIRHKTVRQMSGENRRPMMDTIVELSELYWVGLAGMLRSLTPARLPAIAPDARDIAEDDHVS
ncbi:MAG: magnesium transporter [Geminicoccaceae bacterium]|jgi:magnesium transporter|nr:magnesium transporter [Geminicoccaceae bacterium]